MVARSLRFISLAIVAGLIGAVVFSVRPDVPFEDLQRDYAAAVPTYLPLPSGARAHYRDEGNRNGPPLILVHGSNLSLHTWDAWVRELGRDYRIIRLDLPGHGLTGRVPGDVYTRRAMAEFVTAVADGLDIDRFALAGHSMGGGVAWELALRHPERVTHLILIAPAGVGEVPQDRPAAVTLARNPVTRPLLRWVAPRWMFANQLYESFEDDNFVTDAMIDRFWRLNRLAGNRIATSRRFALEDPPELKQVRGALDVPSIILWGEEDQILPFDRDRVEWDLRSKFAGGPQENPLYPFAEVGHMPHIERAEMTAAFVANFIETHPARETAP